MGDHTNLQSVGWDIVKKLKGSPLAVKTRKVLESKEWEYQISDDDIMPALKLSYNYLCFDLQKCFSYCALFPEDYEFDSNELINLWIGLGLLSNINQNKRVEDTGSDYLYDLVDQGFLEKGNKEDGQTYYVIHDLLHELAVNVSSYECLSIDGSNVRSIQIPLSVRHLSVIIDTTDVKDRRTFENFKTDLSIVGKRMKAENLRTLMLFGDHHGSFAKILSGLFGKAKLLRVLFLSGVTYNIEDIFPIFSKLVHLRYLRIKGGHIYPATTLPLYISRFYHLLVLDLQQYNSSFVSVREMRNLVKLRHFLVKDNNLHSEILEVGKLVCLQELRAFKVKKELSGFELKQLGQLLQLRGSLGIYNLESVQDVNEADEAELVHMNHLDVLILEWSWGTNRSVDKPKEDNILESLKPHSNIREVSIRGHGGATCPTWLGGELYIKNLECLHLDCVSWKSLPPLGELWMINDQGEECPSYITGQRFQNLKRIELVGIRTFKRWRGNDTHFFSVLEVLVVGFCPELIELPFSCSTSCPAEQEETITMFPKLWKIKVFGCPKLLPPPPIPWSRTLCEAEIWPGGTFGSRLSYMKNQKTKCMEVNLGNDDPCQTQLWDMVAFNNLRGIEKFDITNSPPIPLDQMQLLASPIEAENNAQYKFPVECLKLCNSGATGKELTQFVSYFPNLSKFDLVSCETITWLGVVTETPRQSLSASDDKTEDTQQHKQGRGEEDTDPLMEGLLLLPTQIQELYMANCQNLMFCSAPLEEGTEARPGLQGLSALRMLGIRNCPKLLSSSLSSSYCPFPTSLKNLSLSKLNGKFKLTPLSNLTTLHISDCGDLRSEELWPLPVQGHLTELGIFRCPNLFLASEPLRPYEQDFLNSSKLQKLLTDGQGGILAVPVCSHLSSCLTKLELYPNSDMVRFTEEEEEALQKLTSLQELVIHFSKLRSLPTVLNELTNISRLEINGCQDMQLGPKDRLPRSLTELIIIGCPAIGSLPKGILPSSLQTLDVRYCCEELRRQCSKLRGTIPIIKT
ncbi:hypothetical protein HU200_011351 [Digitaria exilis]|uniref:NBS-LRR protein n=1 Tax=Digitaria exilis TaxID=1010633 RepID=A0A835KMS7_9POAL|nr:hypothetical protein HU200_011351 [Digitaria exilis]